MKSVATKIVIIIGLIAFQSVFAQDQPEAQLIDSFTYSNSEDGSARIDNFRVTLATTPNNRGLIIVYGGKVGKKGEIEAHIRGIKQAFSLKKIDLKGFQIINGGFREKLTIEFWKIPKSAKMPQPNPTIRANKVRLKGKSKKIIPYECCF